MQGLGVILIATDNPDAFLDETPTAVMIRQVLGAVAQFEKAALVAKLRGARERKKAIAGKCEGRKAIPRRHRRGLSVRETFSAHGHVLCVL